MPVRRARGIAFAGLAFGLGVGAHLAGGGSLPNLGALVVLAVPVAWIAFFLSRAQRGWPVIIGALLAIEAGLHEGLSFLSGSLEHMASIRTAGQEQMIMGAHAAVETHLAIGPPPAGGIGGMPLIPSFAMVAAHLVATVLTGAALADGERLLWSLWTWLHHAVTVSLELVRLPAPRAVALAWLLTVSSVVVMVNRSVRRRGPPRLGVGLPVPV